MLRFSTKLLVTLFLSYLLIFLRLCSVLIVLSPQKYPKIVTGTWNGWGIGWIWLCPLDYILTFPTKLLAKLRFRDFRIFLRLYSPLTIFASQKPQKKVITGLWKRHGIRKSYFFCLKYMLRGSTKLLVQLSLLYLLLFLILWALCKSLAAAPGVVGGGAPCHVLTWVKRASNNVVLKKIEITFKKF